VIALKNVLIAADFGDSSRAALAYAREVASSFSATLHIVHVVDDLAARGTPLLGPAMDLSGFQTESENDARGKLGAMLDDEARASGTLTAVLTSSHPASAILAYAGDAHIDLIVAGTHGRSGFADMFMGSVAQEIVRKALCPVLTVRQSVEEPAALRPTAVTGRAS
jgi:universal stress protein A